MQSNHNAAPSKADSCISVWVEMYVSGRWTLAEFEAHLGFMLPRFTHEDWLPRRKRSGKRPTAKQAASKWQTSVAASAANYSDLISAATYYRRPA